MEKIWRKNSTSATGNPDNQHSIHIREVVQLVIIKDSVLTSDEEIQERINVFVTFVNQCLEENSIKDKTA